MRRKFIPRIKKEIEMYAFISMIYRGDKDLEILNQVSHDIAMEIENLWRL